MGGSRRILTQNCHMTYNLMPMIPMTPTFRRRRGQMKQRHLRATAIALALCAAASARTLAQQSSLGPFQGETDVGQVTKRGSVTYDAGREQYTIAGSGANMWSDRDAFHFVWRRIQGNFILTARARFNGPGVEPHRKFGWSVRSGLETGSPH